MKILELLIFFIVHPYYLEPKFHEGTDVFWAF